MKMNHGPFRVFLNRRNLINGHVSDRSRVDVKAHIYDDCRAANDTVPIVWSFLVEDYPHIGMCSFCLNRVKERPTV